MLFSYVGTEFYQSDYINPFPLFAAGAAAAVFYYVITVNINLQKAQNTTLI